MSQINNNNQPNDALSVFKDQCNHYWQMNHGPEPEPNKCSLCGMLATHEYSENHRHEWKHKLREQLEAAAK